VIFLGFPNQRGFGPLRDQSALLLGERGVKVEHERIGISAKLGYDERHALGHQPGNKCHVAREAIEFGHEDRTLFFARCAQRRGELRPSVESIGSLTGLDFSDSPAIVMPSASANRATAARCASRPRPDRPWR
jgi:hypothetical protein